MQHDRGRVVIRVMRTGLPADGRIPEAIEALYRQSDLEVYIESAGDALAPGDLAVPKNPRSRAPTIAVVHGAQQGWPTVVSGLLRGAGSLGIDVSSVGQGAGEAALAVATRGLTRGAIQVVLCPPELARGMMSQVDSDCFLVTFQHEGQHVTAITQQLKHLAVVSESVAELTPLAFGLSLQEVCFLDESPVTGKDPGEPFKRTLKKLRALGANVLAGSLSDNPAAPDLATQHGSGFRLSPGWMRQTETGRASVVMSCSDALEPAAWLSVVAPQGPHRLLSVANTLASVIATPEQEWQRWLA